MSKGYIRPRMIRPTIDSTVEAFTILNGLFKSNVYRFSVAASAISNVLSKVRRIRPFQKKYPNRVYLAEASFPVKLWMSQIGPNKKT